MLRAAESTCAVSSCTQNMPCAKKTHVHRLVLEITCVVAFHGTGLSHGFADHAPRVTWGMLPNPDMQACRRDCAPHELGVSFPPLLSLGGEQLMHGVRKRHAADCSNFDATSFLVELKYGVNNMRGLICSCPTPQSNDWTW